METVVQATPDKKADRLIQQTNYIGRPMNRVDGALKVKGEATFSAEYKIDNIAYAALAYSSIAKGKIKKLDTSAAENAEGVIAVISHENAPKLNKPIMFKAGGQSRGSAATDVPILQDEEIYWNGQPIAVVVAETQEQAEHAATLITAEYKTDKALLSFDEGKQNAKTPKNIMNEPGEIKIGDAEKALKKAAFSVDNIYETPRYNHNAIEPHASIAVFREDGKLVLFDASQHIWGVKYTIAEIFTIKPDKVQVVSPFVGGGFGGKGSMWLNTPISVLAAKVTNRAVKLALSREGVFRIVGGRTASEQRFAIGADKDGKFVSIIHSGFTATTDHNDFPEQFTFPIRHLYASPNFHIHQKVFYLNSAANTFMRAPGESIGTFAIESAIDELAYKLNIDPVELRRINEPEKDPVKETEFSSRHLVEAYQRGAKKFGWKHQPPKSQRDGEWLIGQGVATAFYPVYLFPASAKISIHADGTAIVKAAAHEMGMGTATVQLQHSADRLGLSIERISFQYGDSDLPQAAFAGGSKSNSKCCRRHFICSNESIGRFI